MNSLGKQIFHEIKSPDCMRGLEDSGVWFRMVMVPKGSDNEFCVLGPLEVSGTLGDAFCLEHLFEAERWHSLECTLQATVGCIIQNLLERSHASADG